MHHHLLLVENSKTEFNFPQTALIWIEENNIRQLEVVKRLVKGFLKSAHDTLEENEEIHVIHKTTYPYKKWEIEKSAEDAGLFLVKKVNSEFLIIQDTNINWIGSCADETFVVGNCCIFKICLDYNCLTQ
ncbi:hypothetical protein D5086_014090 [Populus alba]|uniref:Uncharacterized protein n=1 Tax=Populus alba TaxID=43335 RepID=A0ACC4C8C7_POPAL